MLEAFDYHLPESAIAQTPVEPRDASKLLILEKPALTIRHVVFSDIWRFLKEGDLLVVNNTRASALRLFGQKDSGGKVEVLLLRKTGPREYEGLVRPAKRLQPGAGLQFANNLSAEVIAKTAAGERVLRFSVEKDLETLLRAIGETPLPPYVHSRLRDAERYQTVYSKIEGSSAAPTAGLHFTLRLMRLLEEKGIRVAEVTLEVGVDTFRPITGAVDEHRMHGERYHIPAETARAVTRARRVIAVGTTSVRALESAAIGRKQLMPGSHCTSLFIKPGFQFRVIDGMLTNFHMPRTTMLLMVSAFCGEDNLRRAYAEALDKDYRFLSFGDCMLIIGDENEKRD